MATAGQRGSGAEILANVEVLLFLHRFQQGKASVGGWRGCSVNRAAESVLFAIILSLGLFLQICVLKGVTPSSEAVVWASAEGDGPYRSEPVPIRTPEIQEMLVPDYLIIFQIFHVNGN